MRAAAAALLCAAGPAAAARHAVLVATSRSYSNYRHQADVCHAYQILTDGGVPAENIVLMMWDDVAGARQNPYKGKLFNKPTPKGTPGVDVYAGCKIDYSGKDVSPDTFLKVIAGNASDLAGVGTGRVLQSGPDDDVFINFVNHGGVGEVCFGLGGMFTKCKALKTKQLVDALVGMHNKQQYKQLVFYLEACESGSMFDGLPSDIGIYALTAANAKESSWGTYCSGDQERVDGKSIGSCLGDLFSVNWMEDAESHNLTKRTLSGQYHTVKNLTIHGEEGGSHVMQFGNKAMDKEHAVLFEGSGDTPTGPKAPARKDAVDARDIPLLTAFNTYLAGTGSAEELLWHVRAREAADARFPAIAAAVVGGDAAAGVLRGDYDRRHVSSPCRDEVDAAVDAHCGGYDEYALRYSRVAVNLCAATAGDAAKVVDAVRDVCRAH